MSDRLNEIQKAIDNFQLDKARQLLHDELQENPSADVYYLASLAAINHGQRIEFLEKSIELDPSYQAAQDELASIIQPTLDTPIATASSTIEQPETPPIATVYLAPIGKRALAFLVDSVIIAVIGMILGSITGLLYVPDVANYDMLFNDPLYLEALDRFQLFIVLLGAIYYIYFMVTSNGQSPGKRLFGIRVIKKNGKPITVFDVILRNVFGYMLSGTLFLGFIWALYDRDRQGWHDKLVGTVVVNESSEKAP